jgi:hypothetical protein
MNFTNTSPMAQPGYVLVLLDGNEKDVLGIWGPYADETEADWALKELNLWPIDGVWDKVPLKHFPAPRTQTGGNYRRSSAPEQRGHWQNDEGVWQ